MDYASASFEELDQYAMEQLIFETDELSPILRGHIFIEKILETLISKNLPHPKAFFSRNRSLDLKWDLAKAMGLLNEKYYSANSTSKCDTRLCRLTVLFEYLDRLPESETFPRS